MTSSIEQPFNEPTIDVTNVAVGDFDGIERLPIDLPVTSDLGENTYDHGLASGADVDRHIVGDGEQRPAAVYGEHGV
jgi:hypothetical protein